MFTRVEGLRGRASRGVAPSRSYAGCDWIIVDTNRQTDGLGDTQIDKQTHARTDGRTDMAAPARQQDYRTALLNRTLYPLPLFEPTRLSVLEAVLVQGSEGSVGLLGYTAHPACRVPRSAVLRNQKWRGVLGRLAVRRPAAADGGDGHPFSARRQGSGQLRRQGHARGDPGLFIGCRALPCPAGARGIRSGWSDCEMTRLEWQEGAGPCP